MLFRIGDIEFGGPRHAVFVSSFLPASHELRIDDLHRSGRDGVVPSREFRGAGTWEFSMHTNMRDTMEAAQVEAALRQVWEDDEIREDPKRVVELHYKYDDRPGWRVAYGRPREYFSTSEDKFFKQGRADIEAEFYVVDHRRYSADWSSAEFRLWSQADGGIAAPLVAPLRTVGWSGMHTGQVVNQGNIGTPPVVVFSGPVRNPRLSAPGWSVGLDAELAWDEAVTIDPRQGLVHSNLGRGLRGALTQSTWLSRLVIPAGQLDLSMWGEDPTGQARAEVRWRHAYKSL